MALSQDQSELLQTAVDNLNKSVEVNKEVLEVVKSVGNTGAVDIAQHDQNTDAHANGINELFAKNSLYVKNKTFFQGEDGAIRLSVATATGENFGYGQGTLFSRIDAQGQSFGCGRLQFANHIENFSGEHNVLLFNIYAQMRNGDDAAQTTTTHSITGDELNGQTRLRFTLTNPGESNIVGYWLWPSYFACSTTGDLGSSQFNWKDCYLQNSPIVSSDRRLKQNFSDVPEAVFKAWANVNFQIYKFKEAVVKKGEAEARKHVGLVAQDIIEAFQAQGLNAFEYGIVCHDEWNDHYENTPIIDSEAVLDADGKVLVPEMSHIERKLIKTAGDVYTVRYEEALALEAAYQRWKLGKIEAALAAKGITL